MTGGNGLTARIQAVAPSATLAVDALVRELRRDGVDVVGFGVGEPDFDTPEHIKSAAVAALAKGDTKYAPTGGTAALKAAVCASFARQGLKYEPNQVVVGNGAKQVLFNACQVLLDPGDEVLIPAPYWVSYVEMVKLAGGVPVIVPATSATGFVPSPADLAAACTSRTRAIFINSPGNPTGAIWPQATLEAAAALAVTRDLCLISDEIYNRLCYTQTGASSVAELGPEVKARTLVVNGVSKTYAMTGWRIGYGAGAPELIGAMTRLQSHATSGANTIAQAAAVAALTGSQDEVEAMRCEFAARRELMVNGLAALPGVGCAWPDGAFYAFPDVSALLGKPLGRSGLVAHDSATLAEYLLKAARVAVVPGSAFGMEGYMRVSYATSRERIATGLARLGAFLGA